MVKIILAKYEFAVSAPYEEGQLLGVVEAQILNALRADNLRECLRRKIKQELAWASDGKTLSREQLMAMREALAKLDETYSLGERGVRRGPKEGSLDAELRAVAYEHARRALRVQAADRHPTDEEIERIIALPEIQAEARRRLRARSEVADRVLTGLSAGVEELEL